jgi:hypothetical protein
MLAVDFNNPVIWLVGGLVVLGIVIVCVAPRLSTKARLERRRRKSNARVVSKSNRPSVKLTARTKEKE